MKKQISFFLLLFLFSFILVSCFHSTENNVNNAKKELWVLQEEIKENVVEEAKQEINEDSEDFENSDFIELKDTFDEENLVLEKWDKEEKDISSSSVSSVSVNYQGLNKFIEIDEINPSDIWINWVEVFWTTLTKVDKIEVSFSNENSDYPDDNYTLTKFKPWDDTFVYRAYSKYQVLDFWENKYTITAYSWDDISKASLEINIPQESNLSSDKEIKYEKKLIWDIDDTSYISFPSSDLFWEAIELETGEYTYSKIDNLKIRKISSKNIECSEITKYLTDRLKSTWFYWNTCDYIIDKKGISVYVIRLNWDGYFLWKILSWS